jgi:hypothetical protein
MDATYEMVMALKARLNVARVGSRRSAIADHIDLATDVQFCSHRPASVVDPASKLESEQF